MKLAATLLISTSLGFVSCQDSEPQDQSVSPIFETKVSIELVPDLQPGEEDMSESERMMKRYHESKVSSTMTDELLKEINQTASWKEITGEEKNEFKQLLEQLNELESEDK